MDLPTATAPEDASRTRAELALRAAAPLRGSRKGRMLAQHDASDLDLFRAVDEPGLFAAPAARPLGEAADRWRAERGDEIEEEQAIAEAEAESERGFEGYAEEDENELGELQDRPCAETAEWIIERDRIAAIVEAEIAAGRDVKVQYGTGRFGKAPYWTLRLVRHEGEVIFHEELELHNTGSFGCWRSHGQATLEAVKLERLERLMRECGKEIATDHHPKRAAQCRTIARWIIDENPPLLSGVDFERMLEQHTATIGEREKLRCTAIRAGLKSYIAEDGRELSIYSL